MTRDDKNTELINQIRQKIFSSPELISLIFSLDINLSEKEKIRKEEREKELLDLLKDLLKLEDKKDSEDKKEHINTNSAIEDLSASLFSSLSNALDYIVAGLGLGTAYKTLKDKLRFGNKKGVKPKAGKKTLPPKAEKTQKTPKAEKTQKSTKKPQKTPKVTKTAPKSTKGKGGIKKTTGKLSKIKLPKMSIPELKTKAPINIKKISIDAKTLSKITNINPKEIITHITDTVKSVKISKITEPLTKALKTTGGKIGGLNLAIGAYDIATAKTQKDKINAFFESAGSIAGGVVGGTVGGALTGGVGTIGGALGGSALGASAGRAIGEMIGDFFSSPVDEIPEPVRKLGAITQLVFIETVLIPSLDKDGVKKVNDYVLSLHPAVKREIESQLDKVGNISLRQKILYIYNLYRGLRKSAPKTYKIIIDSLKDYLVSHPFTNFHTKKLGKPAGVYKSSPLFTGVDSQGRPFISRVPTTGKSSPIPQMKQLGKPAGKYDAFPFVSPFPDTSGTKPKKGARGETYRPDKTSIGKMIDSITQTQGGYDTDTSIVSRFETRGGNYGMVSTGRGDYGGVSYGKYQFASKVGGVQRFLKHSGYDAEFSKYRVNSREFKRLWKEKSKDPAFQQAQDDYAKELYMKPILRQLEAKGVHYSNSPAIRALAMSVGTQHGGGASYMLKRVHSGMTEAEVIDAIMDERLKEGRGGKLAHFKSSSIAVSRSLRNRFNKEREMAHRIRQQEKSATKVSTTTVTTPPPPKKQEETPQQPVVVNNIQQPQVETHTTHTHKEEFVLARDSITDMM